MTSSEGYTADRIAARRRVLNASLPAVRHLLLALTIACILALAALKADGTGPDLATHVLAGALAVAFVALTLIDFRASVAVTIFELVLGGAGGHWVDFGSLSGRIFLISVVTLRAAWLTVVDRRRGLHPILGRYGAHALALAVLIPAIWIPLGLVDGNGAHNVVADGDAYVFFAFVLVVMTLVRKGDGGWLRRLFFAACATNAAAYFLLIVVTASGIVGLGTVARWLSVRLAMGGVIGYMPNGDFRLFTAGSLFLLVGLVLTTQKLLVRPRDLWLWLLGAVLTVDLIATYTRGLWLSALVSVLFVIALEARSSRQLGLAVLIPSAVFALALAVAPLAGFSLYGYVFNRAATITATGNARFQTRVGDPSFEASSSPWLVNDAGGRALRVRRTGSGARTGSHSMELSSTAAGEDAYVFQNLAVKPRTRYSVSAWINARAFRGAAAAERGLLVWDAADGRLYTVRLSTGTKGWKHLSFTFPTRAHAGVVQLRLYAPEGRVLWDDIELGARGPAGPDSRAAGGGVVVTSVPESSATQLMALTSTGAGGGAAGDASNAYKIAEAKALWGYIKRRPLYGYGFGKVAPDFSTGYSYELSYLDLALKAGIIGLLLYLSFPLRLIVDALRVRRLPRASADGARVVGASGVVVGVVGGILFAGATNPYLYAAFGLVSILLMVAWLERDVGSAGGHPGDGPGAHPGRSSRLAS